MANRYWVGGAGTWDPASTYWSTESGGSPGAAAPLATDNAIFDANSGISTVTVLDGPGGSGNPPECANLICTGFAGSIDSSENALNINGDVTLSTGGTYTNFIFNVTAGTTCTLTSVGKSVSQIDIESGATVSLADDVTVAGYRLWVLPGGTFTTNNFNVNVFAGAYWIGGTVNMGSSTFNVGDLWFVDPASTTINAGTSTINMLNTNSQFDGGNKTYYNLNIGVNIGATCRIIGNNTYNTISNSAAPIYIFFEEGSTTTVTNFTVSGTEDNLVTLAPWLSNSFTLSKASGTVSVDYLSINGSNATGGAAWYAGVNSVDVSNNTGWIFTTPPPPVVITVTIGAGIILGPGVSIT